MGRRRWTEGCTRRNGGGYKVVVEKYLLPVAIRPSLCPCLRVSQSLVPLHTLPPWPLAPPLALGSARSARAAPHSLSFSSLSRGTARRGSHSARRGRRTVTRARWRARVRAYARVRMAGAARHEALEKRRCPRMYFLIIDFNDEGSRCQRHLGCWAE